MTENKTNIDNKTDVLPLEGGEDFSIENEAAKIIEEDEGIKPEVQAAIDAEMEGIVPDVLVIHSAGIYQRPKTGKWASLAWGMPNEVGIHTGARTRVIAGAQIAKAYPDIPIVTNSYNRNDPEEPTMASVVKDELIRKDIDEDRIILEEESFSTITQYLEMLKLAKENDWMNISVVINEYYQPRARAIYERLGQIIDDPEVLAPWTDYLEKGGQIRFASAEPILRAMSRRFKKYIDDVENSEGFKDTVRREEKGLQDLEAGRYKYSLTPNQSR